MGYKVVDIGWLGGDSTVNAGFGLNNPKGEPDPSEPAPMPRGHVVGAADVLGGEFIHDFHAFLWRDGEGMEDIGDLPRGVESRAYAINDSDKIVGLWSGEYVNHAVVWDDQQQWKALDPLMSSTISAVFFM